MQPGFLWRVAKMQKLHATLRMRNHAYAAIYEVFMGIC